MRRPSPKQLAALRDAVLSRQRVNGLTHGFYRYPGQFSPRFARAAIDAFTRRGDLVLDPFMGGGTTLVEALASGRPAVGMDISSLAHFVASAKIVCLDDEALRRVRDWCERKAGRMTVAQKSRLRSFPAAARNLHSVETWRVRNWLANCLAELAMLRSAPERQLARAILLRTGQWTLDCRNEVPAVADVRRKLITIADEMANGARALRQTIWADNRGPQPLISLLRPAAGCEEDTRVTDMGRPQLVLTSPPYPGVHVVYNRWQLLGRRETPAPFWIANVQDGHGLSYYTFADRQSELEKYFENAKRAFSSITTLMKRHALIVQLVGFSRPENQLPRYLDVLGECGLEEVRFAEIATRRDDRLWRTVPNRKWYADRLGASAASSEVVLVHRLTNRRSATPEQ